MKRIRHGRRVHGFTRVDAIIVVVVSAVLIAMLLPALKAARRKPSHVSCAGCLKQIAVSSWAWAQDHNDKYPMQVSVANGGTMELVGTGSPYTHFRVLSNELNTPLVLLCYGDTKSREAAAKLMVAHALARGTNRGYSPPFFPPDFPVSYFVGVDATRENVSMWLSGDANLAISRQPVIRGLLSLGTNSPIEWAKPNLHYTGEAENILTADGSVHSVGDESLRKLLQETGVATNRLVIP